MSSQDTKRKTTANKSSPIQIMSLPDDLLLSCFARVSRLYHPTLSLVSKSFRSLITSPELYKTRSSLDCTESCLYVLLCFNPDPNPRWFTLCRTPTPNLTNGTKNSSGNLLVPVPIPNFPRAYRTSVVAVGSNIYNIGSYYYKAPLSRLSVLDCRIHTWHEGPSMCMERYWSAANVLDGKIYVAGGCEDNNATNWMEVFDPKTQTWELVFSPLAAERCKSRVHKSAAIDGKIYMFGKRGVAYKPKEDKWEVVGNTKRNLDSGWGGITSCVIDNVLYCCPYRTDRIKWYDSKKRDWIELKGLEGLLQIGNYCVLRIVDYGGNMAIVWDTYVAESRYQKKMIWCAVLELERRNSEEIWGKVEWCNSLLTVPQCYEFMCVLAATV